MKRTATTRALTCIRLEAAWSAKVEQQQGLHLDNEDGGDDNGFSVNKLLPLCSIVYNLKQYAGFSLGTSPIFIITNVFFASRP